VGRAHDRSAGGGSHLILQHHHAAFEHHDDSEARHHPGETDELEHPSSLFSDEPNVDSDHDAACASHHADHPDQRIGRRVRLGIVFGERHEQRVGFRLGE